MRGEKEDFVEAVLNMMKAQFGHAVKAFWVYDGDLCPCCLAQPIDEMMYEGERAVSVNAFMYRERGVLIAYLLCGRCAQEILARSKDGPTEFHTAIERNLTSAYLQYVNSRDA